jgi:Acetyltransferase (GNAT) domain
MVGIERLSLTTFPWEQIHSGLADRTIYQSLAWLNFLKATQNGEPVLAILRNGPEVAGYFTGVIIRKFGLRILGSPFPGWSTSYMAFNLQPGVSKRAALDALTRFAFKDLRCAHLEFMDRKFSAEEVRKCGFRWTPLHGFEINLGLGEDDIFRRFEGSCRQAIRRAIRLGVTIEEADDPSFVNEYYAQLEDVFAKQGLVPTYDIARVHELIRHIGPTGKLLLLRARDPGGRCIATGIFLMISPTTMYFWGGASWRSYQTLRPNDLLMWTAMRIGKARGMQILDLGGAGDYKKKFGGRPISVPWVRVSAQPFLPLLRTTAKTFFTLKQQLRGRTRWKTGSAAQPPHQGI